MKKKFFVPALVLLLSLAGAFVLVATAPSVENVVPERSLPAVRVRDPEPTRLRLRVRSQGTVAPRTESALVPEVSGRIVWVAPSLVSGGFFDAADPLLRIESRSYEMAVARAQAAVARARRLAYRGLARRAPPRGRVPAALGRRHRGVPVGGAAH